MGERDIRNRASESSEFSGERELAVQRERKRTLKERRPIGHLRLGVQLAFAALCVWIGVEFSLFVGGLESGVVGLDRPPGVDGFLPISALMSLQYYLLTGVVHPFHPAGLFILLAILMVSFVFGKAFCSWMCPVGLIAESVGDFGQRLFGRALKLPRWLDWSLRSVKYLLLAFFAYSIFVVMGAFALKQFLDSPYNLTADVKMYYFFVDISQTALLVIGVLLFLSILINRFWCRYLCPYGALLGIVGLFSPNKITRNPVSCIDCGRCVKACPSQIPVDKRKVVISDECTACLSCVASCPIRGALEMRTVVAKRTISPQMIAITTLATFMLITGGAIVTGYWDNNVPKERYQQLHSTVQSMGHPTSTRDLERLNKKPSR